MPRRWLLFLIAPLLLVAGSEEEDLFLRRIADFWQEGEYQIAKSQMEEFIAEYPESPFTEVLCAALGDLFLREKNHAQALTYYSQIQTSEFYHRVFLSRMQCLYEMQWYATLADECESYLEQGPNLHATYFLAIALYHQCLNAAKEPETLRKLAERARPHFETLSQSELSDEVAQGFAHLCYLLKDFSKASELYLNLAQKNPDLQEEMLFQVALIQSEYDKEQAIQTFAQIAQLGQKRAKEATYNRLVLSFETGRYEDVIEKNPLDEIPAERRGTAHLFLGRSWLHLKKYPEAIQELKAAAQELSAEPLHTALLSLLEAAYQGNDLPSLDPAIAQLAALNPQDPELPKAYFSRAQILKKTERLTEAQQQLDQILTQFPQFPQQAQVQFELAHLDYKTKSWASCYDRCRAFLAQFPRHELAPFAWRYWISAAAERAAEQPALKQHLVADLETFLTQPLAEEEKNEWQLLLAKSYYELQQYDRAVRAIPERASPNGRLLRALCYRDGEKDLARFCELAENALAEGAHWVSPAEIQVSLFNAYIELAQMEKAADHLYAAFEAKADIKKENLLWLADLYDQRLTKEERPFVLANRMILLLTQCKAALHSYKLAKAYSILGRIDEAIALLETLSNPESDAQLLLAECWAKKGVIEKASQLFDAIVSAAPAARSPFSASAALQSARLKLGVDRPDLIQVAKQLKNLVIQKNLLNEPIHLEAALDYIDLQAKADAAKRLSLLNKTKWDFERTDDLLSKDYHAARTRLPEKDQIYRAYMQLIDAEIFAAQAKLDLAHQKDLQAKSKDLLLQIVKEPTALALRERAQLLLKNVE